MNRHIMGVMAVAMLLIGMMIIPAASAQEAVPDNEEDCIAAGGTWTPGEYERVWYAHRGAVETPPPSVDSDSWQVTSALPSGVPHDLSVDTPYNVSAGDSGRASWFLVRNVPIKDGVCTPPPSKPVDDVKRPDIPVTNFDLTVTLVKAWFDVDGDITEAPDADDWQVRIVQGADDEIVRATLPGDGAYTWERGAENETVAYGVQETSTEGWEAVACSSVESGSIDRDFEDTGPIVQGPFTTTLSGVHLVCNQALAVAETVDPSPPTPTPTPEPEVTAPPAEVVVETPARTTPTRIDSGTGGSLDNSGLLALLIMGGLALSGFGITSAATARRRR